MTGKESKQTLFHLTYRAWVRHAILEDQIFPDNQPALDKTYCNIVSSEFASNHEPTNKKLHIAFKTIFTTILFGDVFYFLHHSPRAQMTEKVGPASIGSVRRHNTEAVKFLFCSF